jgi:long-chain acyl-CoA synthetase
VPNLAEGLRASAERLGDKAAVLFQDGEVSYRELVRRADAAAAAFQKLGLRPGDRVAVMVSNSPHFIEAFYGALTAGLVVVPINVTFTAEEVAHLLADSGARAVVVGAAFEPVLRGVREVLPALEQVIVTGASSPPVGSQTWKQFTSAGDRPEPVELDDDALALLQYTSGTTGRPKGAMLTHANLIANHEQMARTQLRVEERDVVLCVLPLFHIYALNVAMAFALSRGATMLLVERFDPVGTLETIARHRASVLIGAPPMYVAWVNTPAPIGSTCAACATPSRGRRRCRGRCSSASPPSSASRSGRGTG